VDRSSSAICRARPMRGPAIDAPMHPRPLDGVGRGCHSLHPIEISETGGQLPKLVDLCRRYGLGWVGAGGRKRGSSGWFLRRPSRASRAMTPQQGCHPPRSMRPECGCAGKRYASSVFLRRRELPMRPRRTPGLLVGLGFVSRQTTRPLVGFSHSARASAAAQQNPSGYGCGSPYLTSSLRSLPLVHSGRCSIATAVAGQKRKNAGAQLCDGVSKRVW